MCTVLWRKYIFISKRKEIVHVRTHLHGHYCHFTPPFLAPVRIVYRRPPSFFMTYLFLYPRNSQIMKFTKVTVLFILLMLPSPSPSKKKKWPSDDTDYIINWLSLLSGGNCFKFRITNAAFPLLYKSLTLSWNVPV